MFKSISLTMPEQYAAHHRHARVKPDDDDDTSALDPLDLANNVNDNNGTSYNNNKNEKDEDDTDSVSSCFHKLTVGTAVDIAGIEEVLEQFSWNNRGSSRQLEQQILAEINNIDSSNVRVLSVPVTDSAESRALVSQLEKGIDLCTALQRKLELVRLQLELVNPLGKRPGLS
ncbi:hypothetical protein V1511DRAFT_455844 [Dipodascopsis uninucleata]